ncbi:MAG: HEPN domain-containing protein [Phycisphaeraceae bacterium]
MNETVREWRDKAAKDLESAFRELDRGNAGNFDLICFLCQQGVEKLIKGAIIAREESPPKTHDLVLLHRMLVKLESRWTWEEPELNWLSASAVTFRYPGDSVDLATATRAAEIARKVSEALLQLFT